LETKKTKKQKNAGQKNQDRRALMVIFLPDIFLLSMVCIAGEPDFENVP
jgi:hypothetical protein